VYNNEATVAFVKDYLFFTPLDIISTFLGFTVLLIMVYLRSRNKRDKLHYRYYTPAFLFKIAFVAANALFYIIFYGGGGDSIAFWDGSVKLNNLFWKDPFLYFEELFEYSDVRNLYKNFDAVTGYPDSHIYEEPASFFISKVASIFTFFTFKGYILMSLIFAYITTNASWRLFELARSFKLHSDWHLALAIFFIPSLSFWCGGISKDTIMWVSVCYFLINIYKIISPKQKAGLWNWIAVLLTLYVMYRVRSFMLVTVFVPVMFAYIARIGRLYGTKSFEIKFLRLGITIAAIAGILLFFQTPIADEYLQEAAVINQDMTYNKTYGANRYSLGEVDYTPLGMIMAFPPSVIAGFYRPFIWESLNVTLILNGIESLVLMYFTFRFFFSGKIFARIRRIRNHEFLIYAFFFALILAFFAGFTSILFGVLVRFKAPVLPFLVMVLTAHYLEEERDISEKREARSET
jgi:hypothetical protein